VVEEVPWSDGKHQLTRAYMLFLACWARKLSWKETAEAFHTSWDKVCDAVEYVVGCGLEHRTLESIRAIRTDWSRNCQPAAVEGCFQSGLCGQAESRVFVPQRDYDIGVDRGRLLLHALLLTLPKIPYSAVYPHWHVKDKNSCGVF